MGQQWIDADPVIRYDAFDCTTYVETVIALAQLDYRSNPVETIAKIRYTKGNISHSSRRHLPEFQWLKELIEEGYLRDITKDVASREIRYIKKSISPAIWYKLNVPIIKGLDANSIPETTIQLPYVPIDSLMHVAQRVDEVSVLSVVREARSNYPILISHQALLIPNDGERIVRHARSKPVNKVAEETLGSFIRRLKRYKKRRVIGVNIAAIQKPQ